MTQMQLPTRWIDSHCHLEADDFRAADGSDDRPAVMARAATAGVTRLLVIGSGKGIGEIENSVALSRAHAHLFSVIGVHPHDATAIEQPKAEALAAGELVGEALWERIVALAQHEARVVAVGETGLDYHYNLSPRPVQQALMRRFVALSAKVQKPLSLHIRDEQPHDAHLDAQRLVREGGGAKAGGVVHCFTGDTDDARAWLDLGFHISFSGIVTFKSATAIQAAARFVPSDRLLLETDCPYLAPIPLRGKRNEPAYLVHTAQLVARLRETPLVRLSEESCAATERLFQLPQQTPA